MLDNKMLHGVDREIVEQTMKSEIEMFFDKHSNDKGIEVSKLYIAECMYRTNPYSAAEEVELPYRILFDSQVKFPHNRFMIDILNEIVLGDIDGASGIMNTPNAGFLAKNIEPLYERVLKKRVTLDEIWELNSKLNNLHEPDMKF